MSELSTAVAMATDTASWSLGVLVALPILLVVIVCLIVGGIFAWRYDLDGDWELKVVAGIAWLAALVMAVLMALPTGYYPYKAEYHQWRPISGKVAEVSKRLVGDGDHGMSEKIVVRYDGSTGAYGCEDTRCALVKVGDALDLKCKRAWQYASVSGYDCRFVARRAS